MLLFPPSLRTLQAPAPQAALDAPVLVQADAIADVMVAATAIADKQLIHTKAASDFHPRRLFVNFYLLSSIITPFPLPKTAPPSS